MKPLLLVGLAATLVGCADNTGRYYQNQSLDYSGSVDGYYGPPPDCRCEPRYDGPRYPRTYRQGGYGYYDPSSQY